MDPYDWECSLWLSHTKSYVRSARTDTRNVGWAGTRAPAKTWRRVSDRISWDSGRTAIGEEVHCGIFIAPLSKLPFLTRNAAHCWLEQQDDNTDRLEALSSYSMLNNKLLPIKDWQLAHGWMGIWSTGTQKVKQDIFRNQIMDDSLPHSLTIVQDLPQEHLKNVRFN